MLFHRSRLVYAAVSIAVLLCKWLQEHAVYACPFLMTMTMMMKQMISLNFSGIALSRWMERCAHTCVCACVCVCVCACAEYAFTKSGNKTEHSTVFCLMVDCYLWLSGRIISVIYTKLYATFTHLCILLLFLSRCAHKRVCWHANKWQLYIVATAMMSWCCT